MGHACPGVPGPPQSPGPRPSRARARCARGSSGFGRARRARRWQSPCTLRRQPPKVWTRPMSCVLEHHERERWGLILAGGGGIRLRPLTQAPYGDQRAKQLCALLRRLAPPAGGLAPAPRARPARRPRDGARDPPRARADRRHGAHRGGRDLPRRPLGLRRPRAHGAPAGGGLGGAGPARRGGSAPAGPVGGGTALYRVRRFWEKPAPALARDLFARGCLWNSLIVVARVPALLALIRGAAPGLAAAVAAS